MKKFFLIPLMALFSCVMAWGGATVQVGTFEALQNAVDHAASGDIIKLTADIAYPETGDPLCLNILKSLTIDGQGHTLSGVGHWEGSTSKSSLLINRNGTETIDVTLKNINIVNSTEFRVVLVSASLSSLTIDNCEIRATSSANNQPITFQSKQTDIVDVTINNSIISAGASGYPVIIFEPIHLTTANTIYSGYCGLYFKGYVSGRAGARGSIVNATNCNFECPNVHSGNTNAFSCFPLEDDGITLNLHNCGMNIEQIGDQNQALVTTNNNNTSRREQPINITISGDNSHFNTKGGENLTIQNLYLEGSDQYQPYGEINVTITGGTYSVNPEGMYYKNQWIPVQEGYPTQFTLKSVIIPDDYEVKTITMDGVANPLYRVVKRAARDGEQKLYNLNDNVETAGNGQNPTTSFELSTGSETTLNQATTKAGYVEVKDHATAGATTVTVAKNNVDPAHSQTLVINNGLDVQGESQVIVEPTAALVIGEGGIVTSKPENIIIQADEDGAASLIMDPAITVNQTPELTVKMTAKQIGKLGDSYYWHRFALPVDHADSWEKQGGLGSGNDKYPTYLYGWDYAHDNWLKLPGGVADMVPFKGYTLTLASEEIDGLTTKQDVVYIFKGKLAGNTDNPLEFSRNGFNFFGNSYTGYISILKLVDQLVGNSLIEGSVWMWDTSNQTYVAVPLKDLSENQSEYDSWQKEVAPMQTFILKQNGGTNATVEINYASAIWGNPRYAATTGVSNAPARYSANTNSASMRIVITAANGQSDAIRFVENEKRSDAFDNGYDATKYMNTNSINVFATMNGENYGAIATDKLEGKTLSFNTNDELAYTLSFRNVNGTEYALRDNVTGKVIAIEEGTTYEFAAQPNSTVEGRFEIIGRNNAPTTIENTEVKANVKGIYTLTGQYVGEDFKALPAGVYVVDGVKIVK